MKLTCASCRWSMDSIQGLHCGKDRKPAAKVCNRFEYEPGADEIEWVVKDGEVQK